MVAAEESSWNFDSGARRTSFTTLALFGLGLPQLQPVIDKLPDLLVLLVFEDCCRISVGLENIMIFCYFTNHLMDMCLQVDVGSEVEGVSFQEIGVSFNDIELLHIFQTLFWTVLLAVVRRVCGLSFGHNKLIKLHSKAFK